mmetsp:Transcript_31996/g.63462  ORF Transcript_31996/g.63462 Transcript_31996/m.63462 type:complete len:204 (+) Transcript_31996:128-739(+)
MILRLGPGVSLLRSCGVMKMNCLCTIAEATSTRVVRAIFRDTASRKTSNSSMTLKGVSRFSPSARRRESVVKERSPPLRALTSEVWLASLLSFCTVRPRDLFLWSNSTRPLLPFLFSISPKVRFVISAMCFLKCLHLFLLTLRSSLILLMVESTRSIPSFTFDKLSLARLYLCQTAFMSPSVILCFLRSLSRSSSNVSILETK